MLPHEDDDTRKYHKQLGEEFHKLLCEPCQAIPKVGDTVVVAAGLIGHGHPWIRREAKVLAVGDTSYKVLIAATYANEPCWIHPALVVEVVRQQASGGTDESKD